MTGTRVPTTGRTRLALGGTFWSVLNALMPTVLGLLTFFVAARLLSPAEFGVVAIANTLVAAALALAPVGFGEALVQRREVSFAQANSVFWMCLGAGALGYGTLFFVAPLAAGLFGVPLLTDIVRVLGLRLILDLSAVVPNALVLRRLAFRVIALRTLVAGTLTASVTVGLMLMGHGLWSLIVGQLGSSLAIAAGAFWTARWRPSGGPNATFVRDLAEYGTFASGTRLLQFLSNQADQGVLGYILGPAQLGIYSFARRVFAMLYDATSGALSTVAHPLFSLVQDDVAKVRFGFLQASFAAAAVTFPVFAGLALTADKLVPLVFGSQWEGVTLPIQLLCALGAASALGALQASVIGAFNRAGWLFRLQLLSSLANLLLVVTLAPAGPSTVIAAIVLRSYAFLPAPTRLVLHLLKLRVGEYAAQFMAPALATAAMAGAVLLLRPQLVGTPPWIGLGSEVLVGAGTYGSVLATLSWRRVRMLWSLGFMTGVAD